jgi:hypothetical protein
VYLFIATELEQVGLSKLLGEPRRLFPMRASDSGFQPRSAFLHPAVAAYFLSP